MKTIPLFFLTSVPLLGGTYSLDISPTSEAAFIELPLPAGAIVKKASHGGSLDSKRGVLKWGPLFPAPPSVTFTLENEPGGSLLVPVVQPSSVNVTANGPTLLDSDRDGLPDEFEARYQVDDPSADHDGDGLSTYGEFLIGTNPKDPSSGLRTISLEQTGDTLIWQVSPELPDFVTLEGAITPEAKSWIPLQFATRNEDSSTIMTAPLFAIPQRRFFRLRFEP